MHTHLAAKRRRSWISSRFRCGARRSGRPALTVVALVGIAAVLGLTRVVGGAAAAGQHSFGTPTHADKLGLLVPVHRHGHVHVLHYKRVSATPVSPRRNSLGLATSARRIRRLATSSSCPNTVANKRGDSLTLYCPNNVELFPNLYGGGYWTDCGTNPSLTIGELSATCFVLDLYDGKLKHDYAPAQNTLTQVVTDACGTQIANTSAYDLSGSWSDDPAPPGYLGSGQDSGFFFRVPPYEPTNCLGAWTITITFTETFSDRQTLTVSNTGSIPDVNATQYTGYPPYSNGGGDTAELGCSQACTSDPVNTATGTYWQTTSDLAVPGRGSGLVMSRTYNSYGYPSSAVGAAWMFSYGMSLSDRGADITVTNANGSQTPFSQTIGGGFVPPPRVLATLVHNEDGSWTYTVRARTIYAFDSSGKLTTVSDLNGNTTTLAYNGSGQVASATDDAGRSFTFAYNGSGQLTSVSDSSGRSVGYGYDGSGNLTTVTDVRGSQWQYTYDSNHHLLTERDANGNVVLTNTYDSFGRVLTQADALSRTTSYSYSNTSESTSDEITKVTNPRGFVTEYDYDSAGQLVKETRALGTTSAATWTYAYDPYVLGLASVTDPNGHTTLATYDHQGNVTSTTSAMGRTTSATYDSMNDLTSFKDGNGTSTTYTYDTRGNILSQSTPLLQSSPVDYQTVTYTYGDPSQPGDLTSVRDANGNTSSYVYDAAGNLVSVTDAAGDRATYTYDSLGRPQTMVTPRGNANGADPSQYTASYSYDAAGNRLSVTDPLNRETVSTYDNDGNLSSIRDAASNQTQYTYDTANELTQITRADGSTIKSSYDADGNLASQTDAAQQTTSYGYDALDHQNSATDPLGHTTSYSVDALGNLLSSTDALNRTTTYTNDAEGELTDIAYSDGATPNVHYGYDNDGQRTSMTDGTGSWTYTFDSLRRLTKVVDGPGDTTSFGYDLANNQTSITYPNGKTVNRTFDAAERMQTISDWLGNTTTFAYNTDSQPTTVTFPASTSEVDSYTYNNADQTASITMAQGATSLASIVDGWDNAGRLQNEATTGLPGLGQSYGYDQLNRLVNSGSYAYDAADNPTTLAGASGFTYDAANELQSAPDGGYSYDSLGERTGFNPTSGTATSYIYDQAGRLTSVSGAAAATYTYDGDGLRATKTVGGIAQHFVWDDSSTLPRVLSDEATNYIYGPGGTPLEQIDAAGNVTYYHHDRLGSTRLLSNSSGAVIAGFSYDPYGNVAGSTGTATTPLGFAGQYTDAETGLIYMRARYYDPTTGQFLSRDPVEQLTRQPYSYVNDNPLNSIDPTGLGDGLFGTGIGPDYGIGDLAHDADRGAAALGNFTAGLAAGATGGYSTRLLNTFGIMPDTCSAFYQGARPVGLLGGLLIPGVGELDTIEEGIYVIRGAEETYVGQSGQISTRLSQHLGRFTQAETDAAERIFVPGGKTAREIAEQQKIDELGGIDELGNRRNPIGPARFNLMPPGYTRP